MSEKAMQDLREVLETLGDTPKSVADALRERGIKGIPNSARRCPIAQYVETLMRERGHNVHHVCSYQEILISAWNETGSRRNWICQMDAPPHIFKFMRMFDRREGFQDLSEAGI